MRLMACVSGIQHIGIPTAQYETTLRFYSKLGLHMELEEKNPVSGEKVAFLTGAGVMLEIYQSPRSAMCHGAIDHVALRVADIEEAYVLAKNGGFSILEEEIRFLPFWGKGVRFFTVEGPNREKIEFCQMLRGESINDNRGIS